MGIRGEIYSTKVSLQNRTYFFNVKENRMGDLYLNIVESKNKDAGGFDRQSVVLFADDLSDFLKGFDESLRVMEKASREKKRTEATKRQGGREERGERPERGDRTERPRNDPGTAPKPRVLKKPRKTATPAEGNPKPPARKPRTVKTFRREDGKAED